MLGSFQRSFFPRLCLSYEAKTYIPKSSESQVTGERSWVDTGKAEVGKSPQ